MFCEYPYYHCFSYFRPSEGDGESKNSIITDQIAVNIVVDVCYNTHHIVTCDIAIHYRLLLLWNILLLTNMFTEMWQLETVWVSAYIKLYYTYGVMDIRM